MIKSREIVIPQVLIITAGSSRMGTFLQNNSEIYIRPLKIYYTAQEQ